MGTQNRVPPENREETSDAIPSAANLDALYLRESQFEVLCLWLVIWSQR